MRLFIVCNSSLDPKSGEQRHQTLCCTWSFKKAQKVMAGAYQKELAVRNLPDECSDAMGEAIPGGYLCNDEAGIYEYADFAFGQLLLTELFCISVLDFISFPWIHRKRRAKRI